MSVIFFFSRCVTLLPGNIPELFQQSLTDQQLKSKKPSSLCYTTEFKAFSTPKGLVGIPQCWIKLISAL